MFCEKPLATTREACDRIIDAEVALGRRLVTAGDTTGPSAWDGYAATVVCDTGLAALHSGAREPVALREKPDLYKGGIDGAGG